MSPAMLLAQASADTRSADQGFFIVLALVVAAFTAANRGAGIGCLGILVFGMLMSTLGSAGSSLPWAIQGCMTVGLGFGFVYAIQRSKAADAQRKVDAQARSVADALRHQRSAVPADARSLGRALYLGGIPTMAPDQEVDLFVSGTRLWVMPTNPQAAGAGMDVSRLADLYVVDGTASVVIAIAGLRGRNHEVELAATRGGVATARQLYALLNAALPARPEDQPLPATAPLPASVCAGCGASIPGGAPRCEYCGRPA